MVQKLLVGDVANISVSATDAKRSYYVKGNPAVSVRVDRSDKGDAIGVQAIVQSVADEMELSLPKDVKIDLIRTRAQAIQDRLSILIQNGLMGLGLVIGLLFLFLSARTAFLGSSRYSSCNVRCSCNYVCCWINAEFNIPFWINNYTGNCC